MPEIIQWPEARRAGLPRYFTGRPCVHGHVAERYTGDKHCVVCYPQRVNAEGKRRARALLREAEAQAALNPHHDEAKAIRARGERLDRVLREKTSARLEELRQASKETIQ